jgi:ketosteroid isomerase-like protein
VDASDIHEIHVAGDWVYVWTQLSITVNPAGGAAVHRSGPGLSIWRKTPEGAWVLYRDANMVTTEGG